MAKKRELRDLQATLDNRESEKVAEAAKAAREDKVRDELMKELKDRAVKEDYPRLSQDYDDLLLKYEELKARLAKAEGKLLSEPELEATDAETEDDLPEEVAETPVEEAPELEPEPKPEPEKKPAPVMVHTPKPKKTAAKPKEESKPKKEPEPKEESKPIKVTAEPGVLPASTSTPAAPVPTSVAFRHDGPGKAYKYWSYKDRCYKLTSDVWIAQQFGQDMWEPVWCWYKDGVIHHLLSEKECEEYLPR